MAFTRAGSLLLATAMLAVPAVSAEPEPVVAKQRPRIGLVLSGGGARGAAHVGVIKVLEELRIPVDYVAGTSMGSIIGGLYSSGLSPGEMEEAFEQVDWTAAFSDAPIRRYISFRRKEDDRLSLFPIELGVGIRGISGKSGIIAGQNINFILRVLTLHAAGRLDFDDLRIPYRAVAADLDTGEMVVLDRGDLALAMRASMSIPAVLTPVEIDGRLLIDGGVARNLPVDVALAMGAERIIAVDVGTPPRGAGEELSAVGVYSQTFRVLAKRNVKAQLELLGEDDALIVPDLSEVRSGGFENLAAAVEAGYAAAQEIASELRQFSVSEEEFAEFLTRQRVGTSFEAPDVTIDRIEIRGVRGVRPELILERLETKAGQPLETETLRRDLGRVMQSGEFQLVQVALEQDDDETKLIIDAQEKPYGPGYLRFGIDLETNLDGDSDFRALAHYRRANVNRLGAEWKTLLTVGEPNLISTEFFQPLDPRGFWFVEPGLSLEKTKGETFFVAGAPLEVIETKTQQAWFDLGVQFRNWGEVRVGVLGGKYDAEASTASVLEPLDLQIGGWQLRATLDQLDNPFFPRHGNYSRLSAFFSRDDFGADEEYDKLLVSTLHAWSAGRNTLLAGIEIGTDLGSDIPAFDEFELGGFLNLSGFTRGELRGDVVALETVGYYFQVGDMGRLGGVYVGGILQAGNVWRDFEEVEPGDQLFSGTLFLGIDTPLSPLYLGYGRAEGGPEEFYVFVGRAF